MKVLTIINVLEKYNQLKTKLLRDKSILTEIQIQDSAFEMNDTQEVRQQKGIIKGDQLALRQFLFTEIDKIPVEIPEFISEQNNKLGTKLNLEV